MTIIFFFYFVIHNMVSVAFSLRKFVTIQLHASAIVVCS